MQENNVIVISLLDSSHDAAVKYRQTLIDLINAGHPQIIINLTGATHCPENFLQVLLGELIQQQGSAWFINSGIMLDADNEALRNQATDVVMGMLQADMDNHPSEMLSGQVINRHNWQTLPVMRDKVATSEDVSAGNAIFYLRSEDGIATLINMPLPQTAVHYNGDQSQTPVIIVQAEQLGESRMIGMYTLDGNTLVGALEEIDLIDPDEFFSILEGEV